MWYIVHKYTIKNVYIHNSPVVAKIGIDRCVDYSARCGVKYIRNKLRTSVLSGTVVTTVVASTPVYF